jgi:hypothetical protein
MWYAIAEPCCVSVLCVGVCDPGETEWSHRRCTGLAFGKVLISPTLCGHLTLAVASVVLGMKTDWIRTDIADIIFVFVFLPGFRFEYG